MLPDLLHKLPEWARRSRLSDPGAHLGLLELMLVEVSHDRPMRINDGSLREGFRGWVMVPAEEFIQFIQRATRRSRSRRAA